MSESPRYSAKIATREFFFYITDKKPAELNISMYKTLYTLVERDGQWRNATSNQMEMSPELVNAVIAAVYQN